MENRQYWTGTKIDKLAPNEVFIAGTNPEGRHGAGAAKAAMKFGLIYGKSSGLQNQAYGLITKNLTVGFIDENGFKYEKEGFCSVSPEQIRANIDELYKTANLPEHQNKKFLVSCQYETYPNGTQKKSLNGYTSQEMLEMFVKDKDIPPNIVFHSSYQVHLEKILSQNLKQDKSPIFNVLPNLLVVSPRDKVPEGFTVLNTTSKDKEIGTKFSPFYLSNIELYEGRVAKNMENAWQFSKVYTEFADDKGNPTEAYFNWAEKGWNDSFAHRYANGKGNAPLYSYWKTLEGDKWTEHKWDYVTARKNIYFPLYAKAIIKTPAFQELKSRVESGEKIALWDFDGYNHAEKQMTYENVVNSAQYKCGHAFVLYGLLTGELKVMDDKLVYDFDLKIPANAMPVKQDKEPEYTYFFQATSPFSQWHPSLFTYKELEFICTEQFMMYAKAKTFGDHLVADKIMNIQDCFTYRKPGVKFENKEDEDCYNLIIDFKEGRIDRNQIVDNYKTLNTWKKVQGVIKKLGREVANYNEQVWVDKRVPVVSVANREKYNQNPDLKAILMATEDNIMVEASPWDKLSTTQQIVQNALLDLREYFKQQNKPKMK